MLFVDRLEETVLVRSKLLEFDFEKFTLMIGDRFLVQYQDVRDVIVMNLTSLVKNIFAISSDAPSLSDLSKLPFGLV